jgi:hypothetical protein
VPKPPTAKPHSDIGGNHRDERPNTEVAAGMGQGARELDQARRKSTGRPPGGGDLKNRDDRS